MEQTPITAGQVLYDRTGMCIENHPSIKEAMEQYAQAKVLEVLKREFLQVAIFDKNGKSKTGIDYFKTQVKPKYE